MNRKKLYLLLPIILFATILALDIGNLLDASLIRFTAPTRNIMLLVTIVLLLPSIQKWQDSLSIYARIKLIFGAVLALYLLNYFSGYRKIYDSLMGLITISLTAVIMLMLVSLSIAGLRDLILIQRKKHTMGNFRGMLFMMLAYGIILPAEPAGFGFELGSVTFWSPASWIKLIGMLVSMIMIYLMVVNSFRVHWIKTLNKRQKIRTALMVIGILLLSVWLLGNKLLTLYEYSSFAGNFASACLLFLAIYSSIALLVTLMHLPTAGVYDRKVKEISSLHHLSHFILGVFDLDRVLQIIIDQSIEVTGARYCWLLLKNETTGRFELAAHKNIPVSLLPELATATRALQQAMVAAPRVKLIEQLAQNKLTAKVRHWQKGSGSLLGVPLISNEQVMGLLFAVKHEEYGFLPDDSIVMAAFANHATLAIENARLVKMSLEKERYVQELKIAHEAQMKLLPRTMPQPEALDIAAACITANEIGGDYFDFFEFDTSRLGVVIGDVSGKGPEAAFYMAEVKGVLESLATIYRSPRELLIQANRLLFQTFDRKTFVSLLYGIYDLPTRQFTFCRAGHCPLLYWSQHQQQVYLIEPGGMAIGLDSGVQFQATLEEEQLTCHPGEVLVLFTDGVTEARNRQHEEYEEQRLCQMINRLHDQDAKEIKARLLQDIATFVGDHERHDDLTLVILKAQ
ncbi:MAG: SpoIIE family protein phosphatase [candidate division KSB1 bacterium]|nr:SpoIIE family protein phosphatase [candidate division KSB1 bacterium]